MVAVKLHKVMAAVTSLTKDKQLDTGARYQYLSEEKVVAELHKAFVDAGLVIVPVCWEVVEARVDTLSNDKLMHNARVKATYRLIDPDDGDVLDVQALGEGADMGDKCLNKCMTAALKYVLRQSCLISSGDDPDHTASMKSKSSQVRRAGAGSNGDDLSKAQLDYLKKLVDSKQVQPDLGTVVQETLGHRPALSAISKAEASQLIEVLKSFPDKPKGSDSESDGGLVWLE